MGFSVTVSNVILFVGLLAAGTTLVSAVFNASNEVTEAEQTDWKLQADYAHTSIDITSATWANGPKTVTITVKNMGSTTLDADMVTIIVDGVYKTPSSITVDGDSSQRHWAPTQNAVFVVGGFTSKPRIAMVATEQGVTNSESVV